MGLKNSNEVRHAGAVIAIACTSRAACRFGLASLPDPAKKIDDQVHGMQMRRWLMPAGRGLSPAAWNQIPSGPRGSRAAAEFVRYTSSSCFRSLRSFVSGYARFRDFPDLSTA